MPRRILTAGTVVALAASFLTLCLPIAAAPGRGPVAASWILGSQKKKDTRAEAEKVDFHITGEIVHGKTFVQSIGHGLVFELVPPSNAPDAGWVIEIAPAEQRDGDTLEFSQIATPPYHAYNDRIIVPAYGRSAADVVNRKDRTFFFVDSVDDEHRAEEVVNAAYYPTDISDEQRVRAVGEAKDIQVSKGELHVLKAHTSRSQTFGGPGNVDSIRFEVDITFSPGLTMADILARVVQPQ
ncbi:MAG: hypothetical protein ACRD8A_02200 [Candidatus Acidiferrales bacterium]